MVAFLAQHSHSRGQPKPFFGREARAGVTQLLLPGAAYPARGVRLPAAGRQIERSSCLSADGHPAEGCVGKPRIQGRT